MKLYATQTIIHQDKDGARAEYKPGDEMDLEAADAKALVKSGAAVKSKDDVGATPVAPSAASVSETEANGARKRGGVTSPKPKPGADPRVNEVSNAAADVEKSNEGADQGLDRAAGTGDGGEAADD